MASWRARKMSTLSSNSKVTCESPDFVSERISVTPGKPASSVSMG